jgi:tetratricopeptide (TPR) repeat protein
MTRSDAVLVRLSNLPQAALAVLAIVLVAGSVQARTVPADAPSAAETADRERLGKTAPLVIEDSPQPLEPRQTPGEEERDRIEALSMFSAARMFELEGKDADALRFYQRALRYDPQSVSIARAIIPLAIRMNRHAEAVRYALLAAELEDADPVVLSRLGEYLADRGDWQRAAALYEKALTAPKDPELQSLDLVLRMQLARLYHLTGQYEKAAQAFVRVFDAMQHPDELKLSDAAKKLLLDEPEATYSLIGECFLLGGRPEGAASAFKKANEHSPDKGLLNYNLARVDAKLGKTQSALKRLNVAFGERLADQGMEPYRLLAEVFEDLGREKELPGNLEDLRDADPENVPLGYFLAGKHLEKAEYDKAEPLYRGLIEKTPTVAGYRALVEIYRKTGQHEKLLDVMAEAVEKTSGLEPLGEEIQAVAEDADLVRSLLQIAGNRLKDDADAFGYSGRLAAALLALEADQYDAAGELFEKAVQAKPDQAAELLLSWGLGLLVDEQYEAAAKVFQRGIDEKALPDENPVFYFYLAGALEMAGKSEQALAAGRKAVEIKPDSPRFHSRVAWILYHGERYEEAVKAYAGLVEQFEPEYGSSEVREVVREAKLVLSNLAVITGRPDQAEEWLEQVLDEFPEDPSAMNDLGYLWADAGKNLRRAHRMVEQAVRAEPDNPAYRDSLGWVLYRLGRIDEAVAALEKAAAEEPDPVILDHLGDACKSGGKLDKARDAWGRAVKAYQEADKADDAEKVQKKINENEPKVES